MSFSVTVPASSANLGPGFDSLALALACYLTVEVDAESGESGNAQQSEIGDGRDMVLYAMQYLANVLGREIPNVAARTSSCIPVARGMGSSAAALIGGMLAANRLLGDSLTRSEVLEIATEVEGHADNLAAALYGGAVLAVPIGAGQRTIHLAINCELRAAIFVPDGASLTTHSRAAVPVNVTREDAVYNASRCALLVHALASGDPGLMSEAMRDRIHQPYREVLYPHLPDTIDAAIEAGGYGASLSGAGPSVLALVSGAAAGKVADAMSRAALRHGVAGRSEVYDLDLTGARFSGELSRSG